MKIYTVYPLLHPPWRTRMTPQIPAPNCKPFSIKHIKKDIKANWRRLDAPTAAPSESGRGGGARFHDESIYSTALQLDAYRRIWYADGSSVEEQQDVRQQMRTWKAWDVLRMVHVETRSFLSLTVGQRFGWSIPALKKKTNTPKRQ